MPHPLRVNVAELLRRPGSDRAVEADVEIADLAIDDERLAPDTPVHVRVRLEALTDGIVVTGSVETAWAGLCRRCAGAAGGRLVSPVDELYQETVTDPEAFELVGGQLDLVPMVREVIVLDVPSAPLCRPDCGGLCPTCGIDRNTGTCTCTADPGDDRWAALQAWQDDAAR